MGACCCSERKEDFAAASNNAKPENKKGSLSKGKPQQSDADAFDIAFEKNDVAEFVRLMDSTEPIEAFQERMHPWAADPRTVGALAGTQLAIMSSMATEENPWRKEEIRAAGALPKFKTFLESKQEDRVQTAVVAFSFLSTDNSKCAEEIFKVGCLPLLLPHLKSKVQGMRGAVASTLRNIYVQSQAAKTAFVKAGGIPLLVEQLKVDMENIDLVLEAILNLEDIVEDEEGGELNAEVAQALKNAGAVKQLERATKLDDPEVVSQAQELIDKLNSVGGN